MLLLTERCGCVAGHGGKQAFLQGTENHPQRKAGIAAESHRARSGDIRCPTAILGALEEDWTGDSKESSHPPCQEVARTLGMVKLQDPEMPAHSRAIAVRDALLKL